MKTLTMPSHFPQDTFEAFALLAGKDALDSDDLRVLALVEAAGRELYCSMAQLSDNSHIRELLNRNGQEEMGHAHRILKALYLRTGERYSLPEDEENPLVKPLPVERLSREVMEMFISGELDGGQHYNRWADNESNVEIAKIFRQNASEEVRHSERDKKVVEILEGEQPVGA